MCGQNFDLVIRNGTVIDGTVAAGRAGDVGVTGDRITAVGDLYAARGGGSPEIELTTPLFK